MSHVGRPDDGTDVTSYFNLEFNAPLIPMEQWCSKPVTIFGKELWDRAITREEIQDELMEKFNVFPSINFNFSQCIRDNVEEALSGVKSIQAMIRDGQAPHASGSPVHPLASSGLAGRDSSINPNLLAGFAQTLYGSNPPTPRELRRETFTAKFLAYYTVGPPRFSDRASTIHGVTHGDVAVSNQFLKGRAQFVLFPPADPNATPNYGDPYANQVTGQATFFPENYLQTGSILILDINGSGADEVNGLPTHATWQYDVSSGGAYTAPTYFTQGLGTVDFQYIPDPRPLPGTLGSGWVVVTFLGLLNQSQVVSAIAKIYS